MEEKARVAAEFPSGIWMGNRKKRLRRERKTHMEKRYGQGSESEIAYDGNWQYL